MVPISVCVAMSLLGPVPDQAKLEQATFVEFDFSSVPERMGFRWDLTLSVYTNHKDVKIEQSLNIAERVSPATLADGFAGFFKDAGFKAELVDKFKVRVYGYSSKGKYYPVVAGKVSSPQAEGEKLPKVTAPTPKQ
jgi:hypothetical protein